MSSPSLYLPKMLNIYFAEAGSGGKKTRGAKMQMLRKQLEESKARQVGSGTGQ